MRLYCNLDHQYMPPNTPVLRKTNSAQTLTSGQVDKHLDTSTPTFSESHEFYSLPASTDRLATHPHPHPIQSPIPRYPLGLGHLHCSPNSGHYVKDHGPCNADPVQAHIQAALPSRDRTREDSMLTLAATSCRGPMHILETSRIA